MTLTNEVCLDCNKFTGDMIDGPFGRDWFIQARRLIAGVRGKRGKMPVHRIGRLKWSWPLMVGAEDYRGTPSW